MSNQVRLTELLRTFLEDSGYLNISERHGGFRAEQSLPGGSALPLYFWPMPEGPTHDRDTWAENTALNNFKAAKNDDPGAKLFFISDNSRTIRDWWRAAAKELGVEISYKVAFFDRNFRFESDDPSEGQKQSAQIAAINETSRSLNRTHARKRVSQPYAVVNSSERGGPDLLDHLEREFSTVLEREDPETSKRLHVVIGGAGAGKSVLFEFLFARLYTKFSDRKKQQIDARRPFQLTPEHSTLPIGGGRNVGFDTILSEYLSNEFDSETNRKSFTWRIKSGYGVWMLDGLDEVIAADDNFFDFLLDLLTPTESWQVPKVLICLRESMLSTNDSLRSFLEAIDGDVPHNVYRLSAWEDDSVDEFLRLFAPNQDIERQFRTSVEQSGLRPLTRSPFYCKHLLDQVISGALEPIEATDPERVKSELLNRFIRDYIERDREKRLIDRRISIEALLAALEMLAEDNYKGGYVGVEVSALEQSFDALLPNDIKEDKKAYKRHVDNIKRLSLFNKERESGDGNGGRSSVLPTVDDRRRVHFVNEVIADYLCSRSLRDKATRPDQLARTLAAGPELPHDGIVLSQIAAELTEDQVASLMANIATRSSVDSSSSTGGVRNLLQLALLGNQRRGRARDVLQRFGVGLQGLKLPSIVFSHLDLNGIDFLGADLSHAVFVDCDLTGAHLNARLHKTQFDGELTVASLGRADFGDLGKFESVFVQGEELAREEFIERLTESSAEANQAPIPGFCPTLEQLFSLVRRFKDPHGKPVRDWQSARTIEQRGREVIPLRDRNDLIRELVRANLLEHETHGRGRYIIQNKAHVAFAALAQNRADLRQELRRVLDEACKDKDCEHTDVER